MGGIARRAAWAAVALAAALALAATGRADTILRDGQGRPIHFDVRADGVDVEWYANLLRHAAHGAEISGVTVRIVGPEELRDRCGAEAGGCYRGDDGHGTLTVPATEGSSTAHTVLHEYAHHVDHAIHVSGLNEPNGTARWWRARGMSRLLAEGLVARDYSRGWDHSIGEIFAEDYVQLHLKVPYKIGWLEPPGAEVRAAVRRSLPGVPARPSNPPPLVITRAGLLQPGASETVPFGLLGPGRRAAFTAWVGGVSRSTARARIWISCDDGRGGSADLVHGRRSATLVLGPLGPGACRATLMSTSGTPYRFSLRLRLTIVG
jgi:hypothetical protein